MKKQIRFLLCVIVFSIVAMFLNTVQSQGITFESSLRLLYENSEALHASEKRVALSHAERQQINSSWFPMVVATGGYTFMSNDIGVTQDYGGAIKPLQEHFASDPILNAAFSFLIKELGNVSLTIPLVDKNWATADISVLFPLFTGGKRYYANRMGKAFEQVVELGHEQVASALFLTLVEVYYGLQLSMEIEHVQEETFRALERHYEDVCKLENNGMANTADRLIVKVALEEANREWMAAGKNREVMQYSLCRMVGYDSMCSQYPVSPMFICSETPSLEWFQALLLQQGPLLKQIDSKKVIAENSVAMGRSNYFPIISLVGKQTIASYHVPKNLIPRTILGATLEWNLFDGLSREREIKKAKLQVEISESERSDTEKKLVIALRKSYTELQNALTNLITAKSSIEMAAELLRVRKLSFYEGMATSSEVVDAQVLLAKMHVLYHSAYYQYDVMLATLLSICGAPDYFDTFSANGIMK